MHSLVNRETDEVLIERLQIAATFLSRFVGLQFRRQLPPNAGLLIAPCSSIHTVGVRFPIDVAFVDSRGLVVAVHESVKPWRVCIPKVKCRFVVETCGGMNLLTEGMQVEVVSQGTVPRIVSGIARTE